MAIKRLKKITLYGPGQDKTRVLQGLQALGCLHLIPLTEKAADSTLQMQPAEASEAKAWLDRSPKQRRQVKSFRDGKQTVNVDDIVEKMVEEILANKTSFRKQSDLRDKLEERIRELRPWGEFSFPILNDLASQRLWFYIIPNGDMAALNELQLPWELIHQDQKDSYVIVVSEQEPAEELLPVPRSHVGHESLSTLEASLEETETRIEDLLAERESLTRWGYLLEQALAARNDKAALEEATRGTLDDEAFFLVQGWVPASEQQAVEAFTAENGVAAIFEEPTDEDSPPTLLEKSGRTGGGADALGFFQTPNYRAWDPGNVVFYSFSLFFAMIMSDAMYSFLFGLIVFMCRSKLGQSEAGSRLMKLAYFMSGLGIVWGMAIGSYFGASIGGVLDSIAFIDLNDYNAMMKLSVVIGVAHLIVANTMTAIVNRGSSYALAPLGWAGIMGGGLSTWLGMTGTLPAAFGDFIGPALMIIGALLVFMFTSTRPVKSFGDLVLRGIDGLKAVYNITSAFGDVLSYMRLFALGLSGASLAMTFNSLAMDVAHSNPVTGGLYAAIILLLGHILNFALCIMSGVVHGMRLNVIEFVNWGLSDEGYPFKAFSKKED